MATWFARGRGFALGVLVGALTLGSALPQLLNGLTTLPWRGVLAAAALLGFAAALLAILLLRVGPHVAPAPPFDPRYVARCSATGASAWSTSATWGTCGSSTRSGPGCRASSPPATRPGIADSDTRAAVGLTAFAAIGLAGVAGCLLAGWVADRHGRARTRSPRC